MWVYILIGCLVPIYKQVDDKNSDNNDKHKDCKDSEIWQDIHCEPNNSQGNDNNNDETTSAIFDKSRQMRLLCDVVNVDHS